MYCWSCGHKNPDDNKFCGDCGKVQVRPPVFVEADTIDDNSKTMNPPPRERQRISDTPPVQLTGDRPTVKLRPETPAAPPPGTGITPTPASTSTPAPPRFVSTNPLIGESRVVQEKPLMPAVVVEPVKPVAPVSASAAAQSEVEQQTVRRSTRISGPSFLGLSDAPDSSGSSESSEYLLEDEAESSSTARSYIAVALVLLLGVLLYKQWDTVAATGHDLMQRATATEPATTAARTPESEPTPPTADTPAYHGLDEAKPERDNASATENLSAEKKPAEPTAEERTAADKLTEGKAALAKAESDAAATAAKTAPKANARAAKAESSESSAVGEEVNAVPPAPAYDDSQVEIAQKYLQGRGVAQDCNRGVSLLRSAALQPNPKAQIKLGALYATGHCVSQDRAEAYRWFAEAHQLQPGNQWIDKNLNSLWAAMTPEERGRVQR